MCPNCKRKHKHDVLLDGTLCNECWDLSFSVPLSPWVSWNVNKKNKDSMKGATMLANYPSSLDNVNTIVATGALTTLTKDGSPTVGISSKTGDKFMNGLKFIFDGRDNKQASLNCVAYGEELVNQIDEFLRANHTEGKVRPFGRLMVECKVQANNCEKNGITQYKNELVIKNIWNAPTKGEDNFTYEEE